MEGLHRLDELADLDAVGADILDRAGADGAGNQRHVLEPGQALAQRPGDQVVPRQAGFGAHQCMGAVVLDDPGAGHRQADHHAREIVGEQQVAALAEHQHRPVAQHGEIEQLRQRLGTRHIGHHRGANLQVEGVAAGQRDILGQLVSAHATPSRRWRMALTHSPINSGPR